jgi:hypothetical protein
VKIAALLLSLAAGLVGCTLVAAGLLDGAVLVLTGLGLHPAGLVRALLLVPPELALLGAGLALSRPIATGVTQVIAVLAWLPAVVLLTPGLILVNAIPAVLMVMAAVFAFGTAVEGAHLRRQPRQARVRLGDGPGRWEEQPAPAPRLPRRPPVVPRTEQRAEPSFDFGPSEQPAEEYVDEEDDYQTIVEPVAPAYARQPFDSGPYASPLRQGEPLERVRYTQAHDDDDNDDDDDRRGPSAFRRVVAAVNFTAFLILALGVAGIIYIDYNRGPRSVFFHDGKTAAATPAIAKADASAPSSPAAPPPLVTTQAAIAPATPTPVPAAPEPAPLPVAEFVVPGTYSDPVKYCAAVDTIDAPDASYTGARVPAIIAATIGASAKKYPDQVHWRCAHRVPLACIAHDGPVCDRLPTLDQMFEHCKTKPGPKPIRVPNGAWHCEGTKPVIPPSDEWPTDSFGYYPPAWSPVATTAAAQ